ncbi:MAG: ABC transporter permease [Actinobacteria bacterium]|nr:ABC transporter permease [Actinomycetota bacterium]
MNDLRLAFRQVKYTNRAFWRNPASVFFTFAFPLMFLVIFTTLFGNDTRVVFGQEISISTFYIAAIAAFSVITACYTNIAISVVFLRDQGVLKRVRGTPLPSWAYVFGRIVHAIFVTLLLVAIVTAFGALFYDAEVPTRTLPAFLIALGVGAASFTALGLFVSGIVPNADAAPAVVNAIILPLLFLGDVFIPLTDIPGWLDLVSNFFPVRHLSTALQAAYFAPAGQSPYRWGDLLNVAIWGVAGLALTLRTFRWEPKHGDGGGGGRGRRRKARAGAPEPA